MILDTETGEILEGFPIQTKQPVVDNAKLNEWYSLKEQLDVMKDRELNLRKQIFGEVFVNPTEGTNKFAIGDGFVLNGGYKLNRKIDNAVFQAMRPQLMEAGIRVDELVEYKPDLRTTIYKKMTDEQRALFDQCLTISPGTPSLEIVKPKRNS